MNHFIPGWLLRLLTFVQVKSWVMGRNKRREWINRDWIEWYYRDRDRQVRERLKTGKRSRETRERRTDTAPPRF